jgi:hypothetical protein
MKRELEFKIIEKNGKCFKLIKERIRRKPIVDPSKRIILTQSYNYIVDSSETKCEETFHDIPTPVISTESPPPVETLVPDIVVCEEQKPLSKREQRILHRKLNMKPFGAALFGNEGLVFHEEVELELIGRKESEIIIQPTLEENKTKYTPPGKKNIETEPENKAYRPPGSKKSDEKFTLKLDNIPDPSDIRNFIKQICFRLRIQFPYVIVPHNFRGCCYLKYDNDRDIKVLKDELDGVKFENCILNCVQVV